MDGKTRLVLAPKFGRGLVYKILRQPSTASHTTHNMLHLRLSSRITLIRYDDHIQEANLLTLRVYSSLNFDRVRTNKEDYLG